MGATLNDNPEIREIFHKCLGETATFNECARLATLADIAESHGGDIAGSYFMNYFCQLRRRRCIMIWKSNCIAHGYYLSQPPAAAFRCY